MIQAMKNKANHTGDDQTYFGFEQVSAQEKTQKVKAVFASVAQQYDLMNDVMSLGIHRFWKATAIRACQLRKGHTVLDLAGGTGDLSAKIYPHLGQVGKLILADINAAMLKEGRKRLLDQGFAHIDYVLANAETLPFSDNYFDRVIIGFGLRNVTNKDKALQSIYRILKPGGFLLILEFSKLILPILQNIYDTYSLKVIPQLGKWFAKDEASYRYLAESIRMHPDQSTLINMMENANFEDNTFQNLSAGIVAIHKGYKY